MAYFVVSCLTSLEKGVSSMVLSNDYSRWFYHLWIFSEREFTTFIYFIISHNSLIKYAVINALLDVLYKGTPSLCKSPTLRYECRTTRADRDLINWRTIDGGRNRGDFMIGVINTYIYYLINKKEWLMCGTIIISNNGKRL